MSGNSRVRQVVLVGGGHAHIQLLRRWCTKRLKNAQVTLVIDRTHAVYSGMVPGFAAGQYRAEELTIDLLPLARRAGAAVIPTAALGVDPETCRVELEGRASIAYDAASFNIGARVAGSDVPGVSQFALPTRPIAKLVFELPQLVRRARDADVEFRIVVAGAGAGGVELAFGLQHALREANAKVTLVEADRQLLPQRSRQVAERLCQLAQQRAIAIELGQPIVGVCADQVTLADGRRLQAHALLWVTGAAAPRLFAESGVAVDPGGFALVRSTLQFRDHDNLFGAGDCVTLLEHPELPAAGVYAVRQGPYLRRNLEAWLAGKALSDYVPQQDFLVLLNLGDGSALGTKWGKTLEGRWVMSLKDRIDRRFVRRFQFDEPADSDD